MIPPNEVTYTELTRVIEDSMIRQDFSLLRARIDANLQRCPLLSHLYLVWSRLQVNVKKHYTEHKNKKLTKDFLALQRVEGALAMLLVCLELNPEESLKEAQDVVD